MKKVRTEPEKVKIEIRMPVDDLEVLKTIVSAFESLNNEDEKHRIMRYLTDRYSKYVPSSNY